MARLRKGLKNGPQRPASETVMTAPKPSRTHIANLAASRDDDAELEFDRCSEAQSSHSFPDLDASLFHSAEEGAISSSTPPAAKEPPQGTSAGLVYSR